MTKYYKVAEHVFGVSGEAEVFALMANYEAFAVGHQDASETVFVLTVESGDAPAYSEELRQEEEGQDIICGKTADGRPVFEYRWWNETAGWLVSAADYREGRLILTGQHTKMAIDNALMVLYALATAADDTVLFHAAVVSHKGVGYMFLGPRGTGKSTHARLWLQHIAGTELVNDDNPVVRLTDGVFSVYGSPWSGKTPCYRNVSHPLGGIVLLSQAPYNKIERLGGLQAYAALVQSISGKRWDERIADGLHQTENALATKVPVWHLACLPDEAAAKLCFGAIAQKSEELSHRSHGSHGFSSRATNDELIIEEAVRLVSEGVCVTLPVDGQSMLPFIIGGKESVILQKPEQPTVGDVVLAWVNGCRYVVHRIIRIEGEAVTLMGDGNLSGTEQCTLGDIKAIVTHVVDAKGKRHAIDTSWRRWAARLWWQLRPMRRYLLYAYRLVKSE